MKLTPLDIHHKEFRNSLRGYNPEEVDDFLDEVAGEFERLFKENIDLSEKRDAADVRLAGYTQMEQTLQKTLVAAQTSAEDIVARARAEADRLVKDAEAKAAEIVGSALEEKQHSMAENSRLVAAEEEFRARFRRMLETYLGALEPVSAVEAVLAAAEPASVPVPVDVVVVDPDDASQLIMETGLIDVEDDAPETADDAKPATVVSLQLGEVGEAPEFDDDFPVLDVPAEFSLPKSAPVGELDDDIEEID